MESRYKVGDVVEILGREGAMGDYPWDYTDTMLKFMGRVVKIKSVKNIENGEVLKKQSCRKYYTEPYVYTTDGTDGYLFCERALCLVRLAEKAKPVGEADYVIRHIQPATPPELPDKDSSFEVKLRRGFRRKRITLN